MNKKILQTVRAALGILSVSVITGLTANAQKFQLGINTADLACLGTLNAAFEYGLQRHWSIGVSGKYNPFTYGSADSPDARQMQMRQRSLSASARWWPWHIYSGWWVGGEARWQEYNFGGIISQETEEGRRYGGGIRGGYTHMITSHLNLDLGLGVWAGWKDYVIYECPKCGKKIEEGQGGFFLPSDIIIALTYVF